MKLSSLYWPGMAVLTALTGSAYLGTPRFAPRAELRALGLDEAPDSVETVLLICNRSSVRFAPRGATAGCAHGDLVQVASAGGDRPFLGRILALSGEYINCEHGRACFIDRGHCWIEGADAAADSRAYGPLPLSLITHRVDYWVAFPPSAGEVQVKPQHERLVRPPWGV